IFVGPHARFEDDRKRKEQKDRKSRPNCACPSRMDSSAHQLDHQQRPKIRSRADAFYLLHVSNPGCDRTAHQREFCSFSSPASDNFKINEHGISFQYPQGWSVEHRANMYRLVRTTPDQLQKLTNADRQGLATITTSVENRKDHADALLRLRQIAAESNTPSTF